MFSHFPNGFSFSHMGSTDPINPQVTPGDPRWGRFSSCGLLRKVMDIGLAGFMSLGVFEAGTLHRKIGKCADTMGYPQDPWCWYIILT